MKQFSTHLYLRRNFQYRQHKRKLYKAGLYFRQHIGLINKAAEEIEVKANRCKKKYR